MAGSDEFNLYFYNPSTPLAITFSVLYSIMIPVNVYLCIIRARCCGGRLSIPDRHRYTIPLLCASSISTSGFVVRTIGAQQGNWDNVTLYAISSSYIVISPIFVCATLYLLLTRMMGRFFPEETSAGRHESGHVSEKKPSLKFLGLTPIWLGRIFIASDITSFLTQGAGSGIASSGNWEGDLGVAGVNVLRVGLVLQLVTFVVYLCVFAAFWHRVQAELQMPAFKDEKKLALAAIVASLFVLARSIFRTVEFTLGFNGYPFRHEWMLYVFEAVPILAALALLAWWHPIRCLKPSTPIEVEQEIKTNKYTGESESSS